MVFFLRGNSSVTNLALFISISLLIHQLPTLGMEIALVTSNKNKVREFRFVLEPLIKVNHLEMHYPELRHDSNEEIAKESAERLANELNKTVVVEDSGMFIESLKGFPGVCSAYIHKRIGLEGILKLMQGQKNRRAYYVSAVAFAEPGKTPHVFSGREDGTIAQSIRGSFGFGHDPLFVPDQDNEEMRTYGEMEDFLERKRFRKMAIIQLREFLENKEG